MVEKKIETQLVQRQSTFPSVCIHCNKTIPAYEMHYAEEGITEHLHSLIARKFCTECYVRHGEQPLLQGPHSH